MFNSVDITGRIANEVVTTHPEDDLSRTEFRLYALKDSSKFKDEAAIPVVAFNGVGLSLQERFHKGDTVRVQGRIRYRTWKSAQGEPRSAYDVIVNQGKVMFHGKLGREALDAREKAATPEVVVQ